VVARLDEIIEESEDPRSVVNASKALIAADRLNQEQEKRDLEIPDRVEMDISSAGQPLPPPPAPSLTIGRDDLEAVRRLLGR
jgi:hypothetical protein